MNPKHLYMGGFVITVGMITYGSFKHCQDLPWPPRFIGAAMVFGILDLFSGLNEELAGIVAIGIAVAAVVQTLQGSGGFVVGNCEHAEATVQPASYESLQGGNATGQMVA